MTFKSSHFILGFQDSHLLSPLRGIDQQGRNPGVLTMISWDIICQGCVCCTHATSDRQADTDRQMDRHTLLLQLTSGCTVQIFLHHTHTHRHTQRRTRTHARAKNTLKIKHKRTHSFLCVILLRVKQINCRVGGNVPVPFLTRRPLNLS